MSIEQEDITILNVTEPNKRVSKQEEIFNKTKGSRQNHRHSWRFYYPILNN